LADYIRSWRVQGQNSWFAQVLRPAGEVHYRFDNRWSADANLSFSRGQGFHSYDNVQNSFFISYTKPIRRSMKDVGGPVPVEYPLRFSFGIETADYFNFTGQGQTILRPMVRLTVF
jgi:hypothetical protein